MYPSLLCTYYFYMGTFGTKNDHSALPFWQYQFPHANQVNSSQDMAPKIHS